MERLQIALEQESSKQHRQRLRRTLRRASQRTLRRLRAEQHEPPAVSADEQAQAPALPPLQSVLVGRSTKAHLTLDNRTTLCGYHLDSITTAAPSFIEHHDCPRCAQQARQIGYSLP